MDAAPRPPGLVAYLGQIARSAEQLGFEAALTPTGAWCEDAWLTTAMLSQLSERLKFLVAFRPGLTSPTLAAQMAATFQNLSGGRLLLNVVTGGETPEQRATATSSTRRRATRAATSSSQIVRRLWAGETVDFDGRAPPGRGRRLQQLPDPLPAIYFGGSSPAAGTVAARHADVYLTWGEPPAAVAEKIAGCASSPQTRAARSASGSACTSSPGTPPTTRGPRRGRLLDGIDDETIATVQAGLRRSESEGQRRMLELNRGSRTTSRSTPTCGPASAWSAAVRAPRWSAATRRSRTGSRSTTTSASTSSSCRATRTWRSPTPSAKGVLPMLASRGLWTNPAPASHRASVPFGASRAAS